MLKIFLFCIGLFFSAVIPVNAEESFKKKTICLNMIVKDESPVIKRCLASLKPFIDYWIIVDTGSSDGTQEVVKEFMKDIPGELHERPWINFASNRNEALLLAKNKADYLLFIDADEELIYERDFKLPVLEEDYYYVTLKLETSTCQRKLLVNNHFDWQWMGVLHEQILCPEAKKSAVLSGIVNSAEASDGNRANDSRKHIKDAEVLSKALEVDPANIRYLFYLGQSYMQAKEYTRALEAYEKVISLNDPEFPLYTVLYNIGILNQLLDQPSDKVINSYCRAYQSNPSRAEALFRLTEYYFDRNNYIMGYAVSKQALSIPNPHEQIYNEDWIYDYGLLFAFGNCACGLGKHQEAIEVYENLLKRSNLTVDITNRIKVNLEIAKKNAGGKLEDQRELCFYSQFEQDKYLHKNVFKNKRNGVFVDVGAHDGITFSNTCFFEKSMGWTGVLVEPIPVVFEQLKLNRSSLCVQGCIHDKYDVASFLKISGYAEMLSGIIEQYDPKHVQRIRNEIAQKGGSVEEITVKCYSLARLLKDNQISHVDYLSIDTEGSELEVLKSIDFREVNIDVIDVENNYNTAVIEEFLRPLGYVKIAVLGPDEIYLKDSAKQQILSKKVEVVANFDIQDFFLSKTVLEKEKIDLSISDTLPAITKVFFEPLKSDKVIVFNMLLEAAELSKIPKEKLVYFLWEPWEVDPSYYESYGKVYTWNDDLVDNVKFFKLYYPSLMPMVANITPFEEKKLCAMVAGRDVDPKERNNDLYSERIRMVEFFETKPQGELEIYGKDWKSRSYRDYKGPIPGFHSGDEKISTLKNYRFSICFENTKEINGYVTEKIFCCFAAGCVPIYWGAKNIETYIPKECYIDYRDFKTREELYSFIKNMPKAEYQKYLDGIQSFLSSEKAKVFAPANLQKIFCDSCN